MSHPSIRCPKCGGAGSVSIPEGLIHTLKRMGRGEKTASDLLEPNLKHPTICNRLAALLALGLVSRERKGREWVYFKK